MRSVALVGLVALLALSGTAAAQTLICAADLNGDGAADQTAEQGVCLALPGGPHCPLQQAACIATPDTAPGFACPLNPALACVQDGSGGAYCSPNACFTRSAVVPERSEPPDSGGADNGPRDANGNCIGDLQIFAGQSSRCRRAGVETLFSNCCANHDDVIRDEGGGLGSIGMQLKVVGTIGQAASIAATSGLEAANAFLLNSFNPTTMAIGLAMGVLLDMLQSCDQRDMETALLKDSGYCVAIGTYCAERWPVVGCVQRAESHCCFNSKLARIVQEQGRAQIPSMGGFGSAREPNCRGFRPEEFQAIDFSKIDLSEYFDELHTRSQQLIEGEIRTRVEDRF